MNRFNPCGKCCSPCRRASYSFARPDSTTIGSGWEEKAGDWEIKDNALTIAAPAPGDTAIVNPFGLSPDFHSVTGVLRSSASGDQLGVVLSYTDAGAQTYALLTIHDSDARLKIVNHGLGITAESVEAKVLAPTNTDHTLRICAGDLGDVTVYLNGTAQTRLSGFNGARIAGVCVGNVSGAPEFKSIVVDRADSTVGCPCYTCSNDKNYLWDCSALDPFWTLSVFAWSFVGGRIRATHAGNGLVQSRAQRCHSISALAPKCTITIKTRLYWEEGNPIIGAIMRQGIGCMNNGGESVGQGSFVNFEVRSGLGDEQFYMFQPGGGGFGGTSTLLPGTPVSGDELALVITDVGGGEVDADFRVNGASIHTEQGISLDLFAHDNWRTQLELRSALISSLAANWTEWDDYSVEIA